MNIFFAILSYSFYFFLSGSNWYECTRKFGNSYENKSSSIFTKSVRILSIKWWSITRFSLHCLHRWASVTSWIHKIKNDKWVTNSQGVRVYTFISRIEGRYFFNSSNISFFYVYFYDYEMKYHCKKPFHMNFKAKIFRMPISILSLPDLTGRMKFSDCL